MHEMSVALSVADQVEQAARAHGATGVERVRLDIGELAGVVPDSLHFCFELVCAGTLLDGAELLVRAVPGRASCTPCGREWATGMPPDLTCPGCRSAATALPAGRELTITEVRWARPPAPAPAPIPHREEN
ncbi:hydrogenase maturation nickel metallochaperone HypA [Streptomyces tagetis]|uniref:Hydrogenase maturation factor HypA n=1 Tax=Streptomyces tagetis TaxID=2820809 RepID=A0A941B1R9_9ACTN|nr:hydrogenase maturation nickel metallochaperone HypA [Streptomyces sp. RG38]MBQ0826437.1 hydrogenase maturation nickel metallochaperone HypA [Streptomyces sp. RG38]